MPRKPVIRSSEFPYHIVNRSNNKDFFYIDLESLWHIFMDEFHVLKEKYECDLIAFVLMSNHYHLIMRTPEENISAAIEHLQREVARKANKRTGRINHFFGGKYKGCLITNENYYWNALKYVFRNPVQAGVCLKVEDYGFSSLNRENQHFKWSLRDIYRTPQKPVELDRDWLNTAYHPEEAGAIWRGLRRREFKMPADKSGSHYVLPSPLQRNGERE